MTQHPTDAARHLIRYEPEVAREVVRLMAARPAAGLTARQRDAYEFIRGYHAKRGITPSFSEIAAGLGLASKSAVFRLVSALEERGYISRLPHYARSIVILGAGA